MSSKLDEGKLANVKLRRGGGQTARCPACAKEGHDKTGDHLVIYPGGEYACIKFPGDEGKEHRKRVFELVGKKTARTFETLDLAIADMESKLKMKATRRDRYNQRFVVVRFDPPQGRKVFRPFHLSDDGWICKDPPGELPLFNLTALRERSEEKVVLVEGEKCVVELSERTGLLVTTSAHGAFSVDNSDWRPLAGRKVVILPDNDQDGKTYAQRAASALLNLDPPAEVKNVELQGLPPKGDCVDWLQARNGESREDIVRQLEDLISAAREEPQLPKAALTDVGAMKNLDEYIENDGGNATPDAAPSQLDKVSLEDFRAYMPQHNYIFVPARDVWPAASVNARIPPVELTRNGKPVLDEHGNQKYISASAWLDQNRPVEQMTWAPGLPMLIKDRLVSDGGWIPRGGCTTFNLYRPPNIKPGDAEQAQKWLDHVANLYPNDVEHILKWLAHRVQRPHEKINHALFLGGSQGIGKDTLLYPVKTAVGQWNVQEILPPTLLGRFNGFVKSVLLTINEAHDLGDLDRYTLYERLKAYTAAPPDVIRVDEKHLREYAVFNVCGVIITSNFKTSGLYLPGDDRRHYVAWSDRIKADFSEKYWREIYAWYDRDGCRHVAACLAQLDISGFNPKAPPPKTDAFWEIVQSNQAPENTELADALEALKDPDAVTIKMVIDALPDTEEFRYWLKDRRNARLIPHRFEEVGYVAVRNPDEGEGRWKIGKNHFVIYAKKNFSRRDQIIAARKLVEEIKPYYP